MTSSSNQRDNQQPRRPSMAILLVVSCVVITVAAGIGLGLFISNRRSSRLLQSQPQYQWNEVHGLRETLKAITGTNDSFRVAVSPDGHTIAVGGQQTIRIWDSKRKEVVAVIGDDLLQRIDALTFNSDGRLLAVAGWGSVVLFDVTRHTRLTSFTLQDCLGGVAFHPTEPLLLASSSCGRILLKKWVSPSLVDVKILDSGSSEELYQGPYYVSFSPDGRTLAASDHDGGHVNLWNVGSWAKRTTLNAHVKIWHIAFNPDGRLLAASAGDMDRVQFGMWKNMWSSLHSKG